MNRCLRAALVFVLAVPSLVGCRSRITGNEGNFEFSYFADDNVRDFNKPIAVGAKLEVTVRQVGTQKAVDLTSAGTDNESVLKVDSFSSDKFVLLGVGNGGALVSVEGKVPDGTVLKDSVNMSCRVPEVLTMAHTCITGAEARYFVNQDVLLPFEMKMKTGQAVIGYGYQPITIAPPDGATLDKTTKDQVFFHLHTAANPATVTVSSSIDSTTARLILVRPADINGAVVQLPAGVTLKVATTHDVHILPTVGGQPVCQPITPITAVSKTTAVCDVNVVGTNGKVDNEYGFIRVTGRATGTCDFTVSHSAGNGGAGQTTNLSVVISS